MSDSPILPSSLADLNRRLDRVIATDRLIRMLAARTEISAAMMAVENLRPILLGIELQIEEAGDIKHMLDQAQDAMHFLANWLKDEIPSQEAIAQHVASSERLDPEQPPDCESFPDFFSDDFFPMDDQEDETSVNADEDGDYERFGLCPICGNSNGYLNIRKDHFGVCHNHKIIWSIGYNIFSSWMDEDETIWKKNREILEQYEFREPVYRWRDASKPEIPSHELDECPMSLAYSLANNLLDELLALPNPQAEDLARASLRARGDAENFIRIGDEDAAKIVREVSYYLAAFSGFAGVTGLNPDYRTGLESLRENLREGRI